LAAYDPCFRRRSGTTLFLALVKSAFISVFFYKVAKTSLDNLDHLATDMIVLVLAYTLLLVYLGRLGRRKARNRDFITGGRQFNALQVFFMISALWCSWIFIVEIESAYLFGVSAIWFGVAVGVMAITSLFLLTTRFTKLSYITNSGVIGKRFGPLAGTLTGLVIGVTFPIFAMSNVLAAAVFVHTVTGWPFFVTLLGTVIIILAYILAGGIWALAYTQIANFIVISLGLIVGTISAIHVVPLRTLPAALPAMYLKWDGVGISIILVWLFSNLLSAVSAQAEFQILMAASDPKVARRGLSWAMLSVGIFSILSVIIGVCVRAQTVSQDISGIQALPDFYLHHTSPFVVTIMTLAVWAAALTWSAPLMFSGASSLGADVIKPGLARHMATAKFCVQLSLPFQALLVILFALMRPDNLAWWQVLSLTIRNGAIFSPTIALLVWPIVKKWAAMAAIILGSGSGILWNTMGGFSTVHFIFGINPMWVGTTTGIVVLVLTTLLAEMRVYKINMGRANTFFGRMAVGALIICGAIIVAGKETPSYTGPLALIMALAVLGLCALTVEETRCDAG